MTLQIIAFILLAIRISSVVLVYMVIVKQVQLFRRRIDYTLSTFRLVMFLLAFVFLISNGFPIVVDSYYAFIDIAATNNALLEGYAISNALNALAGSILLWKVYDIAGKQIEQEASVRQEEK